MAAEELSSEEEEGMEDIRTSLVKENLGTLKCKVSLRNITLTKK